MRTPAPVAESGAPTRGVSDLWIAPLLPLVLLPVLAGCTSPMEYLRNGFKVGPNYEKAPAPVAPQWIDAADSRVRSETADLSRWWTVFNDPVLDSLTCFAYQQNLNLRVAGCRVLEARAQLAVDVGNLFPQTQNMTGDFNWHGISKNTANNFLSIGNNIPGAASLFKRWYGQYDLGFNLAWELDFWGRFRRMIESDTASLDASVENYDSVLVTLLGDVATNYVNLRVAEQRIRYAQENVDLQRETLRIVEARLKAGTTTALDVAQARSTLEQTEATIPELRITLRQYSNQLCILLGIPPEELRTRLGPGPIPTTPTEVVAGIPGDLLRRRPDVRQAERQAAAQSAQIGVAEAGLYPHISISGDFNWSAEFAKNWFTPGSLNGTFGPTFTWNILNYGRLLNNVRLQDATFQERIATYQNTVLTAANEVENGLATFLNAQERTRLQAASVEDALQAVKIGLIQYRAGTVDFTRVTQLEQTVAQLQDTLAVARGEIATGLITVYRALGGGWEIREQGCTPTPLPGDQASQDTAGTPAGPQATPQSVAAPQSEMPPPTIIKEPRAIVPARIGSPESPEKAVPAPRRVPRPMSDAEIEMPAPVSRVRIAAP
jgi:NodT family efflux transporter outer membrane factor (OMF) lipoprotein